MNTENIRTRFAPSPTGFMHIGNLRTALYTYIIAKKYGGKFILRIEDTDQGRYVEGATEVIYDTLRSCGLNWDEGPDVGGPVGPYVQSERMGIFKEYAEKLVETGHAYYCFCTKERMEKVHEEQQAKGITPTYDRHCRDLPKEEVDRLLAAGTPYVIRQKVPLDGTTAFRDELYGEITVPNADLDDQILLKADGMPTYNFANVVDDHLMGITHVVRGNEYLSSAPKYNLLYEAFGWEIPTYIHVEHIMRDERHKLSKRDGDAYFGDFTAKGYYIPAILNYIALLGWSPKGEQEIFTLDELVQEFDISGISKSPAIFDPVKMKAINAEWLRRIPQEEFKQLALPYIRQTCKREDIDLDVLCKTLQPRTELLTDIPEKVDFIDELREYGNDLFFNKKMKTTPETALSALDAVLPVLESIGEAYWTEEVLHEKVFAEIERLGVKNGWVLLPMRAALSGKPSTPGGGIELAAILGRKETLARIKQAISQLS
ncbi:MAG: glutamate--tRNA ligase [Ruminococcus sp.]|nr:glutamate--tRNA ligase [Ruminococcus sp.]MCM1380669.1 glutamate--tRNA ligase [Muribaculaceae bacterium]MCM1478465.1 glutamate--tRNA ligase [Muribaculaceae bacterium]